jgi:hypothetical protein
MGIPDYQVHAGQCRDLFRRALGITSGNHDSRIRILPAHSADCGARILVRAIGYRTGIQDYYGSLRRAGSAGEATLFKLSFQSGAIRLGGATSEIFHKECGHTLW